MKKLVLSVLLIILTFTLISCKEKELVDNYSDDLIEKVDITTDSFKVMQVTDLHLSYGFDSNDRKTFKKLSKYIDDEKPDLIVVTGDVAMTIYTKTVIKKMIKFFESKKIPWTITIGNHERDFTSIISVVNLLMNSKTNYLRFHYGPNPSADFGYSNFKVQITKNNNQFLNIYLMDSKDLRRDGEKGENQYDYFSNEQVSWFNDNLSNDTVKSLAFMHMPIVQYENYEGIPNETIWPQGKDTGFFDAILNNDKKTVGIFAGHDHTNNFSFYYKDILLAYGISTGYNAYGKKKGVRMIEVNSDYSINTYLVGDINE